MNPNTVGPEVGRNDLLRTIGGVLLATFAFVLFIRKGQNHRWGDFALLLVLLVPFLALYGAGTSGPALVGPREAPGQRWHAVFVVLAVILAPLTLFQFLHWVGGNTHDSLNAAWIFGLTAVVAGLAARRAGVSYATLLAGLAIVIAWLELWDKILNPSGTTVRWLLLIIAVLLVGAAVALGTTLADRAGELVTAGGLAAIGAGIIGLAGGAVALARAQIGTALGGGPGLNAFPHGVQQHFIWDLLLLAVSLALIFYGSRRGTRGQVYVGGLGLFFFVISVGIEFSRILGHHAPKGSFVGWPLALLILAVVALAVGFRAPAGTAAPAGGSPPPPAPPPAPPAT